MTKEDVIDIFTTCTEGGSNYWAHNFYALDKKGAKVPYDRMWKDAVLFTLTEREAASGVTVERTFTWQGMEAKYRELIGLKLEVYRRIYKAFANESWDAGDADALLQLTIFDELVYG